MAKRKKRKSHPKLIIRPIPETTSTEVSIHPNATLGPDASLEQPSTGEWVAQDSTSAPEIGKESEATESYAGSEWALVDKYIFGGKLIPFALVVIVIGWIIIQDNGAGELTDWNAIWWTIQKCSVVMGLYGVILLIQCLYQKIFK